MERVLGSTVPVHFPKRLKEEWDGAHFLSELLTGKYQDISLSWRICSVTHPRKKTTREFESTTVNATFHDFFEWYHDLLSPCNPFTNQSSRASGDIAVYADYQRFHSLFASHTTSAPLPLDGIGNWATLFGSFANDNDIFDQSNSNLWLGTQHAHTPLHFDTYGCNIVVQLVGRKNWQLWQPRKGDSANMDCLRIPYEESSVYSINDPLVHHSHGSASGVGVGVGVPDFQYTLCEGDVLFVPKHYWHFVSTAADCELSLSVNLWLPMKSDSTDHLRESIVKFMYGSCLDAIHTAHIQLVHEREDEDGDRIGCCEINNPKCESPCHSSSVEKDKPVCIEDCENDDDSTAGGLHTGEWNLCSEAFNVMRSANGWLNPQELDNFCSNASTAAVDSSVPSSQAGHSTSNRGITSKLQVDHASHISLILSSLEESILSSVEATGDEQLQQRLLQVLRDRPDWAMKTIINALISPLAIDRCLGDVMAKLKQISITDSASSMID